MTWLGLDPVTTTEPLNTQATTQDHSFLGHARSVYADVTVPVRRRHTHTYETIPRLRLLDRKSVV